MKPTKLIVIIILTILLIACFTGNVFAATQKDEMIYANLKYDGKVLSINVVNRLYSLDNDKMLVDYGKYNTIKNLTNAETPIVQDYKISFSNNEKDLFYEGTLNSPLPVTVEVKYLLDGKTIDGESLAGANGKLKIHIKVNQNTKCPDKVRETLIAQISVKLDANKAKNINIEEGSTVVVGNHINITQTIMPGLDGSLDITCDAHDFEMSGINITLTNNTIELSDVDEKVSELEDGFDTMAEGIDDMVEGTQDLKDGIGGIVRTVKKFRYGLYEISEGGKSLRTGMDAYVDGLTTTKNNMTTLATNSNDIRSGLDELDTNLTPIYQGYQSIEAGLNQLSNDHANLVPLAQGILADPTATEMEKQLANAVIAEADGIETLKTNINALNTGLNEYHLGLSSLANGFHDFDNGVQQLPSGMQQLINGFNDLNSGVKDTTLGIIETYEGMYKFYKKIKTLPNDVETMVDGQNEFRDGILEAKDELGTEVDNMLPKSSKNAVSFVMPEKNKPNTVQYFMHTPDITLDDAKDTESLTTEKKTFWQRFIDLFVNLFNNKE